MKKRKVRVIVIITLIVMMGAVLAGVVTKQWIASAIAGAVILCMFYVTMIWKTQKERGRSNRGFIFIVLYNILLFIVAVEISVLFEKKQALFVTIILLLVIDCIMWAISRWRQRPPKEIRKIMKQEKANAERENLIDQCYKDW